MVKKIDCRGLACPQPVLNTKKALEEIKEGTVIVIVDNPVAKDNVTLFARNAGCQVEVTEEGENFTLTITRKGETTPSPGKPKDITSNTVYFITSNILGQGSPDLGQVLMKSLLLALSEQQPPPGALIFLNTGVYLSTEGSPVLEYLHALSAKGTAILSCGTCLEYYRLKEKLSVGKISNMYEINDLLSKAEKVITVA